MLSDRTVRYAEEITPPSTVSLPSATLNAAPPPWKPWPVGAIRTSPRWRWMSRGTASGGRDRAW